MRPARKFIRKPSMAGFAGSNGRCWVSRSFTLEVLGLPATDIRAAGIERAADGKLTVEVGPDQTREVRVSLQVPAAKLPKDVTNIDFKATEIATGETASVRDHFVPATR